MSTEGLVLNYVTTNQLLFFNLRVSFFFATTIVRKVAISGQKYITTSILNNYVSGSLSSRDLIYFPIFIRDNLSSPTLVLPGFTITEKEILGIGVAIGGRCATFQHQFIY